MRHVTCVVLAVLSLETAAAETTLHVAPGGADANPGTLEAPFATVERARDTIRDMKAAGPLDGPVTVYLRGGTYRLAEPYRRFQAELGIDDSTSGGGSVRFRVYVDGHLKYTSEVVRGGSPPLPVSVELAQAKRLDLIVDFADFAHELDHADWLNARLVR